jgi:hypothetical protein
MGISGVCIIESRRAEERRALLPSAPYSAPPAAASSCFANGFQKRSQLVQPPGKPLIDRHVLAL